MKIEAHRLSGLGNIILLVDLIRQPGEIKSPDIKKIIQMVETKKFIVKYN